MNPRRLGRTTSEESTDTGARSELGIVPVPSSQGGRSPRRAGVPSPQGYGRILVGGCQELGHTAGGERGVSEGSLICFYSGSPLLELPPELHLLLDQQRRQILTGAQTVQRPVQGRDTGCMFLVRI